MSANSHAAGVTAIVLAAGASRRFGPADKLLVEVAGEPLVAGTVRRVRSSRIISILVVTSPNSGPLAAALAPLDPASQPPIRMVANPESDRGIGRSIAAGISAVAPTSAGAMIVPADLPRLDAAVCNALIDAFEAADRQAVVYAATADGQQRNPVIWPRRLFDALARLDGDRGGKSLIADERAAHPDRVIAVAFADDGLFHDIDRPADLDRSR